MENLLNYSYYDSGYGVTIVAVVVVIFSIGLNVLFACLTGNMAKKKGMSYGAWWCLSFFLLGFIALIIVACMSDKTNEQQITKASWVCPNCSAINEGMPNANGSEFCPHFGTKRQEPKPQPVVSSSWVCPKCNANNKMLPNSNGNEFCPHCGTKRAEDLF